VPAKDSQQQHYKFSYPEEGGNRFFRNAGNKLSDYRESHHITSYRIAFQNTAAQCTHMFYTPHLIEVNI
jgi:hypothetical protein